MLAHRHTQTRTRTHARAHTHTHTPTANHASRPTTPRHPSHSTPTATPNERARRTWPGTMRDSHTHTRMRACVFALGYARSTPGNACSRVSTGKTTPTPARARRREEYGEEQQRGSVYLHAFVVDVCGLNFNSYASVVGVASSAAASWSSIRPLYLSP